MFFTLVITKYSDSRSENDVLRITKAEWEKYSEDNELYLNRATGKEKDPEKIIESIIKKMDMYVNESEKKEILKLREERLKKSPLYNLFDEAIFSYEVGYLKPQAEIYQIALEKMNVNPEKSIFIGDGGSDELKGAKK